MTGFFIKTALRNLWESKVTSFFTLVTLSVALGFMGAYLAIFINMKTALGVMSEELPLMVYLSDGAGPAQTDALKEMLASDPAVARFEYTSKEQALKEFSESLGDKGAMVENLGDNPLPASFNISIEPATGAEQADKLIARLGVMGGVDDVQYLKEEAGKLRTLMGSLRMVGLLLGLCVLLGVVFISYSTLRLAVLNHRDEIEVLKLMGATRLFVMAPFLIEGALQGLLAALASLGMLYGVLHAFSSHSAVVLLSPAGFKFLPVWAWFGLLAAGGALGLTGSFFAFSRTLRM